MGDRESIGAAIGRIPSGCSILTVEHGGRKTGVLVSWVQQASFEPLSISVCLRSGRPASELLAGSGRFMLNVVGDEPSALFRHFGRGFALDEDAFSGLPFETTEFGPRLRDCIAHLGCRVIQKVEVGDHELYVALAATGSVTAGRKPYVHIRKTGLTY
jgi:flavin reductase (DIM6/NTAB) family NADH-FMN oxidoreductase RutF